MTAGEILIERGRVQGELRARRVLVEKLLTTRFGALPSWAVAKLDAADIAGLDAWFERAINAATLEEALAD